VIESVLTIVLVLFSVVALMMFFLSSRDAVDSPECLEVLQAQVRSLDLEAFLTLMDRRDAEFLHATLKPAAFRKVHRLRTRAALKYLKTLFSNVAVLLRIGDLATHSADPVAAEAGRDLVQVALRTRILILRTVLSLAPQLVVPTYSNCAVDQLLSDYSMMSRRLTLLTAVRRPQEAGTLPC
jgi:hypothetical protein